MPLRVNKREGRYVVSDPEGRTYGSHSTRDGAEAQVAAINIAKARKRGHRIPRKT